MFNLRDFLSDDASCSCSTEEEFTPESVYRSLLYTSSDSSCCGGAPDVDDEADELNTEDDESVLDDDEDGGGPPPPPVDEEVLPTPTWPPGYAVDMVQRVFRTALGTYTADQPVFGTFIPNPLNSVLIQSVVVTNKADGSPADPLQQEFGEWLFGDNNGDWRGCADPNQNLLEFLVTFNYPIDFNCLNIHGNFNLRNVYGDGFMDTWDGLLSSLPPAPAPGTFPNLHAGIQNFQLLTERGTVFYDDQLNSGGLPPPWPHGSLKIDRGVEYTGLYMNQPKHIVYNIGRLFFYTSGVPPVTQQFTVGQTSRFGFGLTHKFRFQMYPSDTENTGPWNFSVRDTTPIPP
jgi:hypothetical protein